MIFNKCVKEVDMKFLELVASAIVILAPTSANAALIERLGGLAYYDDVANLTWLADANTAGTAMTWADANNWAASLTVGGVGGWRLADTVDVGNDGGTYTNLYQGVDAGYNITVHSELSNMFYNVLGNGSKYNTDGTETGCVAPDYCLSNRGPFSNLQSDYYWSATAYAIDADYAWGFGMDDGGQGKINKSASLYAWAVQSGDVSAVPVPAAVWLFASGLITLIGFSRRQKM
jgi:hypothetical protein